MKLLNLAIASIVDANTGNGLNRDFIDPFGSYHSTHQRRAHEIRSRSFLDLVAKIKTSAQHYIEDSKTKARNRQAIKDLAQMDDRFLKDIGLSRADLYDIDYGSTDLETLNARRNSSAHTHKLSQVASNVGTGVRSIESANQELYEAKKCA
jgi:uncharacterized protein YjiS (DUF1127 family)